MSTISSIEDIAARLEDMSIENDLPELQGLANALGTFARTEGRCEFCEARERESSIPTRIVEMMLRMGVLQMDDLERFARDPRIDPSAFYRYSSTINMASSSPNAIISITS